MADYRHLIVLLVCAGQAYYGLTAGTNTNETEAQAALDEYNRRASEVFYLSSEAAWDYNTNITTDTQEKMLEQSFIEAQFNQEAAKNLSVFNITNFNPMMKREIQKITDIGISAQTDNEKLKRLKKVMSDMETIYSKAKVCMTAKECMYLEPGLTEVLSKSRDYDRLKKAWVGWREESGKKMKDLYTEFVTLSNEALKISGWKDTGEYWRSAYEMDGFEEEVKSLFEDLKPLYEQLHAYVRRKLVNIYGQDKFPDTRQIPAHLLGNMWAQQWNSLIDIVVPFKDKPSLDVTPEMVRQNYTYLTIFQKADEFFGSLGLIKMPQEFWDKSMLHKPTDGRDVVCHASAWDFYNAKDFRIKQCTEVTDHSLQVAHHEMGHVEYFLQYKQLDMKFRDGANPGFHEAVGDVMSLSVQTPKHMRSIGLLTDSHDDNETDINFLMNMALQKIAFLPFGYLIDQWRWSVFRGDTTPDQYNEDWWKLRCKYQGISPPVKRTSSDFDPGAKYHIPANTPYIRYFVSFVIQFQFHKAACSKAGHTGPLYKCDIYNSKDAGKAIGDMLKLGSSEKWPVAMKQLTGQEKMSVQPLLDYFDPLYQFLKKENEGEEIGWTETCPNFADSASSIIPSISLIAVFFIINYLCQRKVC